MVEDELRCEASMSIDSFDVEPLSVHHLTSTPLFDAIVREEWDAVNFFLESGSFSFSPFQSEEDQGAVAEDQAETWIICDNEEGKLLWRQLPLHAALCYGAPFNTIKELLKAYPAGACCADLDGNLPVHLAIKFNRDESILRLLLKALPDSFHAKNCMGQTPLDMAEHIEDEAGQERYKMLTAFVESTEELARKEQQAMQDELDAVEESSKKAKTELAKTQRELWYLKTFPIHRIVSRRRNRFRDWKGSLSKRKVQAE